VNNFNLIRYSGDDPFLYGLKENEFQPDKSEAMRKSLLSNSLRITKEMFPEINNMIETVLNNLKIDTNVESYITSDPIPQAMCITQLNSVDFIIVITSSLLELLSPAELSFIVGHEIGHYIFEHYKHPRPQENESQLERFNKLHLSRCAEISADRMGLLATIPDQSKSNIEVAVSSMIKVVSGVSDRYFKLNISSYLKQGRDLIQLSGNADAIHSTHPVFPDRVPALMQFEISQPYYDFNASSKTSSLDKDKLDSSINKKMNAHQGNALEDQKKELSSGFTIWSTMLIVHVDGELTEQEFIALSSIFGEDIATELKEFYSNTPTEERDQFIHDMIKQELTKLNGLGEKDRDDILSSIESIASECGGNETEIKENLKLISGLLNIEREISIKPWTLK